MRGDCQRAFEIAAAADGIVLSRQSLRWLCERGHLALPDEASGAREVLERIFLALGGNLQELAAGRSNRVPGDFIHEPTRTPIETDEPQHFTASRLAQEWKVASVAAPRAASRRRASRRELASA
jgi:hypothetical protein